MRTKTTIVILGIVLTAILCSMPALGIDAETAETKARLEALVEEYIACCEAKSALRSSCMKAAYCRHSKEELVELMLEKNVEPKAYKVRHFLNDRFNVTLQAKK